MKSGANVCSQNWGETFAKRTANVSQRCNSVGREATGKRCTTFQRFQFVHELRWGGSSFYPLFIFRLNNRRKILGSHHPCVLTTSKNRTKAQVYGPNMGISVSATIFLHPPPEPSTKFTNILFFAYTATYLSHNILTHSEQSDYQISQQET